MRAHDAMVVVADWIEGHPWIDGALNAAPRILLGATRRFPFSFPEWFDVRHQFYRIKWTWQRARRGWSDRDTWGFDSYLFPLITGGLKRLRITKHGVPSSMFDDPMAEHTDEAFTAAIAKWDGIMDEMIDGFGEAHQHLEEHSCMGVNDDCWKAGCPEPSAKMNRALDLFKEHWGSLWD